MQGAGASVRGSQSRARGNARAQASKRGTTPPVRGAPVGLAGCCPGFDGTRRDGCRYPPACTDGSTTYTWQNGQRTHGGPPVSMCPRPRLPWHSSSSAARRAARLARRRADRARSRMRRSSSRFFAAASSRRRADITSRSIRACTRDSAVRLCAVMPSRSPVGASSFDAMGVGGRVATLIQLAGRFSVSNPRTCNARPAGQPSRPGAGARSRTRPRV